MFRNPSCFSSPACPCSMCKIRFGRSHLESVYQRSEQARYEKARNEEKQQSQNVILQEKSCVTSTARPCVTPQEKPYDPELSKLPVFRPSVTYAAMAHKTILGCDISLFKKIYAALYAGESSLFKKDALAGTDNLTSQQVYNQIIIDKPDERAKYAWQLTLKYSSSFKADAKETNSKLFRDIYLHAFERSGIFKRSRLFGQTIFSVKRLRRKLLTVSDAEIKSFAVAAKPGSRTAMIKQYLS